MAVEWVAKIQVIGVGPLSEGTSSTFGYYSTNPLLPGTEEPGNLALAFETAMADVYRNCVVSDWHWYSTIVGIWDYNTTPTPIFSGETFDLSGAAGNSAGSCDAIERAVIIKKISGIAGRTFRGRVFMPMPRKEVADVDGRIDPTFMPPFDLLGAAMLSPIATMYGTWSPCINHFFGGLATVTDIIDYGINGVIGIQRRRRARFAD